MGRVVRGKSDQILRKILGALRIYESAHPKAVIEAYRQNPASVRVRIVDPDFAGLDRAERHDTVWRILERLDEKVLGDVTILLLLTPQELSESWGNLEFEHPSPSRLH
jgi:stress-induced morphogen